MQFDRSLIDSGNEGDATSGDATTSDAGDAGVPDTGVDASDGSMQMVMDASDGSMQMVMDASDGSAMDAGEDAGMDTGTDAGEDAGIDAGEDAGMDAGTDAGDGGGLLANGATCASNGQCQSNACVGTTCCATSCTDQGAANCSTNGQCLADGSACATYAVGTVCVAGTCSGDTATNPTTCNAAGHCAAGGGQQLCAPYAGCSAGVCATTCSGDGDCVSGNYCSASHCIAQLTPGEGTCTANDQCTTNVCGGGICCAMGCTPSTGTCGSTGCSASAGACLFPGGTTACSTSCSGSTLTTFGCNGSGGCSTTGGTGTACGGNLVCASNTTCLSGCGTNDATGDANCVSGFYCDGVGSGSCQAVLSPGSGCTRATECQNSVCTGGICDQCTDGIKDGNETDVDCGGPTCGPCGSGEMCVVNTDCQSVNCQSTVCIAANVLILGAGASSSFGAELHPSTLGSGTWSSPVALTSPTDSDLGIAFASNGSTPMAVGVMRYLNQATTSDGGTDGMNTDVVFTTWSPTHSFAAWASVGSGITTRQVPGIFGTGGNAFLTFQGTDFNQYYELWSGSWPGGAETITNVSGLPTPAAIAAIGFEPERRLLRPRTEQQPDGAGPHELVADGVDDRNRLGLRSDAVAHRDEWWQRGFDDRLPRAKRHRWHRRAHVQHADLGDMVACVGDHRGDRSGVEHLRPRRARRPRRAPERQRHHRVGRRHERRPHVRDVQRHDLVFARKPPVVEQPDPFRRPRPHPRRRRRHRGDRLRRRQRKRLALAVQRHELVDPRASPHRGEPRGHRVLSLMAQVPEPGGSSPRGHLGRRDRRHSPDDGHDDLHTHRDGGARPS